VLDLSFIQEPIAGFTAGAVGAKANGIFIEVGKEVFEVTASCTGIISASILAAIIFSLRKPELKKKILFFLGGAIILFTVNLLRLYLVLSVGKAYGVAAADLAHIASWFAMSAAIIMLWYYGTKKLIGVKEFPELV
jgi:exosortase/archaeosortase family protein